MEATMTEMDNYKGATAMHYAAKSNSPEILEMLLAKGAAINAQDENGFTPLMYAIMRHSNKAVRFLAESGADLSIASRYDGDCHSIAALAKNGEAENILKNFQ